MADAIPSSSAALLAAQAKGGQAGVDAYQAAMQTLQQQRSDAVQQAMQEAALRGAPQGAVGSIQSTITSPYDARIASLAQQSASWQADQQAQASRQADYAANYAQARQFIPLQTAAAVAPIKAKSDADIAMANEQSQEKLAQMRLQGDLTVAQMNARAQAAQIAARAAAAKAAKAQTLNQGELQSMLQQGATQALGGLSGVGDVMAGNVKNVANTAGAIGQKVAAAGSAAAQKAAGDAFWKNMAARYTGAGIQADIQRQAAAQQAAPPPTVVTPQTQPGDIVGYNRTTGLPIYSDQLPPGQPVPPWVVQSTTAPKPKINVDLSQYAPAQAAMTALANQSAQLQPRLQQITANTLAAGLAGMRTAANAYSSTAPGGGRILLTPQQLQAQTPFAQSVIGNALGKGFTMVNPEDFTSTVLGDPTRDIQRAGDAIARQARGLEPLPNSQGVGSPFSSDVVRAAYQQAASDLVGQAGAQGIDITAPEIQNALPGSYKSVYDFLGGQANQPTSQQAFQTGTAGMTKAAAAATKADADGQVRKVFGRLLPTNLGSSADIVNYLGSPSGEDPGRTNADTLDEYVGLLQDEVKNWKDPNYKNPTHDGLMQLLRDSAAQAGRPVDEYLLSLAMAKIGK